MTKVILIYANCINSTAKGDFALAGKIAVDSIREIKRSGGDLEVILTSTLDGIPRFKALYKDPNNPDSDHLTIQGEKIGLCALESFDPVENTVVAFIEANRCKYASADILRRVLSPTSVFLFVGAANQPDMSSPLEKLHKIMRHWSEQPKLYSYFNPDSIFIGSAGVGPDRLGLPNIESANDLPALSASEASIIPKHHYGFMYLAAIDTFKDIKLIVQYMQLTHLNEYVVVGAFASKESDIINAYRKVVSSISPMPNIHIYPFLSNPQMRKMVAGTTGDLVVSTGVMSTLEAMKDRKLTYYQDMSNNDEFVASYMVAVKSIVSNDTSLFGNMPQLIIELSDFLFKSKPLSPIDMKKTQNLLAISSLKHNLIEINEKIVAKTNGKLAHRLLSFIGEAHRSDFPHQLTVACENLRKSGETQNPKLDQALRRAAAWGRLFELKLILQAIPSSQLDSSDATSHRSALLWATLNNHSDCVHALLNASALIDIQDKEGKTPLHYAVQNGEREIIKLLVEAGASTEIEDSLHHSPLDSADASTVDFIERCQSQHRSKYIRVG